MLLFTIGMIGLKVRFGQVSGRLGNIGLMIAIAGGGLAFLSSIPLFALWVVYEGIWWVIWISSMLVLFTGLFLFGIDAFRKKPFPRWNAVPLLTGVWFPVLGLIAVLINLFGVDFTPGGDPLWLISMIFVVFGSMVLGHLLQSDVPEKPLPAT